jgi:FkbM family methyltransferase
LPRGLARPLPPLDRLDTTHGTAYGGCSTRLWAVPRDVPASSLVSKVARVRQIAAHPANEGRALRQLGTAFRAQATNRVLRRPAVVPMGMRSRIFADVRFPSSMLPAYGNPPDVREMCVWLRHLRRGDLFVDVGANVGLYSLLAAEAGAYVIAVEADAGCAPQLGANMRLNGYPVELHTVAASDRIGLATFTVGRDTCNALGEVAGFASITVPTLTLDAIVAGRSVAGIKVDVEGAEHLVLRGARDVLERGVGLLQLEWNDTSLSFGENRQPVADLLAEHGYKLFRPDAVGDLHRVTDIGFGADVFACRP